MTTIKTTNDPQAYTIGRIKGALNGIKEGDELLDQIQNIINEYDEVTEK